MRSSTRPFAAPAPFAGPFLLLPLLLAACGGPPAPGTPAPDGNAGVQYCPPPLVFEPGAPHPVRLRIENRTADTLDVWIDRCWWHTWLASVPPGKYRQPALPDRLITFPEGLRFHAFDMGRRSRYGIYHVPFEERGILTLVLDDGSRVPRDSLTMYALEGQDAGRTIGTFAVLTAPDRGYAALQAEHGLAIMTWSCADGEPEVGVSLPTKVEGEEVDVGARRDEGAFESVGRWRVQRGPRDAVVPPEGARAAFRRRLSGSAVVDLRVDDDRARQVHRFHVDGLEEALGALGCRPPSARPAGGPPPAPSD
jgi:hypothetical protein